MSHRPLVYDPSRTDVRLVATRQITVPLFRHVMAAFVAVTVSSWLGAEVKRFCRTDAFNCAMPADTARYTPNDGVTTRACSSRALYSAKGIGSSPFARCRC